MPDGALRSVFALPNIGPTLLGSIFHLRPDRSESLCSSCWWSSLSWRLHCRNWGPCIGLHWIAPFSSGVSIPRLRRVSHSSGKSGLEKLSAGGLVACGLQCWQAAPFFYFLAERANKAARQTEASRFVQWQLRGVSALEGQALAREFAPKFQHRLTFGARFRKDHRPQSHACPGLPNAAGDPA